MHAWRLVFQRGEGHIDLRTRKSAGGQERIDSNDAQSRPRHRPGKLRRELGHLNDLPGVRHRKRELTRSRCRIERITMDRAIELSEGATEGGTERGSPWRGNHASATSEN